jgi:hypothetical protein
MDVRAFISEATDSLLKVELAHKTVEAAKLKIEEAKADLEIAKAGVATAKEGFEGYVDQAEGYGLTKSRFKDAVERMKGLLVDIGALAAVTAPAAAAPSAEQGEPKVKAPRKKKGTAAEGEGDTASGQEGEASIEAEGAGTAVIEADASEPAKAFFVIEGRSAPAAVAAVETADEVVIDSAASQDAAVIETAGEAAGPSSAEVAAEAEEIEEIDNSVALAELSDLVDEIVKDADVKTALRSAIAVTEFHATNIERKYISASPSPLAIYIIGEVAKARTNAEIAAHIEALGKVPDDKLHQAISWFNKAVELLADGKESQIEAFSFAPKAVPAKPAKVDPAPAATPVVTAEAVVESAAPAAVEEVLVTEGVEGTIGYETPAVDYSETIEAIELFDGKAEDAEVETEAEVVSAQDVPSDVEVQAVAESKTEETKPAASVPPVIPSRPAWLNKA